MNLLLDSHILLWWLGESKSLSPRARASIETAERVFVSAATAWELSIKAAAGKLRIPDDLAGAMAAYRFEPLPITVKHGLVAGALPHYHGDPFDRMLVAQASVEALTLVTHDRRLIDYGVAMLIA